MIIMAEMCLCPSDEGVFDSHTNMFVHIIRQQVDLWFIDSTTHPSGAPQGPTIDISRSTIDLGVIAPLYYTAVPNQAPSYPLTRNHLPQGGHLGWENSSVRFTESDEDRRKRVLQKHRHGGWLPPFQLSERTGSIIITSARALPDT
jgi:hypothetical protein